ncbi:MAG: SpoIIE family protein phosphatase, partial [Bacteroidia bacterium]|nr:SpoIIE family protein phosphatase [Bacteroidia bacterium]
SPTQIRLTASPARAITWRKSPFRLIEEKNSREFSSFKTTHISRQAVHSTFLFDTWHWVRYGSQDSPLRRGRFGDLWGSSPDKIYRICGEKIEEYSLPPFLAASHIKLTAEENNGVWVVVGKQVGLLNEKWHKGILPLSVQEIYEDPQEGFWGWIPWGEELLWQTSIESRILQIPGTRLLPIGFMENAHVLLVENAETQALCLLGGDSIQFLYSEIPLWRNPQTVVTTGDARTPAWVSDQGSFFGEKGKFYKMGPPPPLKFCKIAMDTTHILWGITSDLSIWYLAPWQGEWKEFLTLKEKPLTSPPGLCRGSMGEIWVSYTLAPRDNFLIGIHPLLYENIPLPFPGKELADFTYAGGYLWALQKGGILWRGKDDKWQKLRLPKPISQTAFFWDTLKKQLWIGSTAHLLLWDATTDSYTEYPLDSISLITQDNKGRHWLLRKGKLYCENVPFLIVSDSLNFVGPKYNGLWLASDSTIYIWIEDENKVYKHKMRNKLFTPLGVSSNGYLWLRSKTYPSVICLEQEIENPEKIQLAFGSVTPNPKTKKPTKIEGRELGESQGVPGRSNCLGLVARENIYWQTQDNEVYSYKTKEIDAAIMSTSWTHSKYTYHPKPKYKRILLAKRLIDAEIGTYKGREGEIFRSDSGLIFWPEGRAYIPPYPPRLYAKWKEETPILDIEPYLQRPVSIGGASLEEVEELVKENRLAPTIDFLGSGRWPTPTFAPFEASFWMRELTFEFIPVGAQLYTPSIEYQYRLLGASDTWQSISSENKAFFFQLPDGSYTLEVRYRVMGGGWSPTQRWSFRVRPPFWQTPLAYIIYLGLAIGGIALYVRYRLRSLRKRAEMLQREVDRATTTIRSQNEALQKAYEELREQKEIIEGQKQDLIDSLLYAQRIQAALLPRRSVLEKLFPESFILFQPKDIVSGDIYWFYIPPQQINPPAEFYLLVADCTGHGVPGAFVSLLTLAIVERVVGEGRVKIPGEILEEVSKQIAHLLNPEGEQAIKDGFEGVLCHFKYQEGEWHLSYAAARRPFWIVREGEVMEFPKDPRPVGLSEIPILRSTSFTTRHTELKEGDWIYFSSDGYSDQLGGPAGKRFGTKRFRELVQRISLLSAPQQEKALREELERWRKSSTINIQEYPQVDDVLVVGLKVEEIKPDSTGT